MNSDIDFDLVSYNTVINLYCWNGKLKATYKLLDEIERHGICDKYNTQF